MLFSSPPPLPPPHRVRWHSLRLHMNTSLAPAHLTPAQKSSIRRLLLAEYRRQDWWECRPDTAWVAGLSYYRAPLGRAGLIYISPAMGCMRGGQGANAALWLVDAAGTVPRLLASPDTGFNGWGLGVEAHVSHGLHDFVTGWHDSAIEYGLAYFRFDGRKYRSIDGNIVRPCKTAAGSDEELSCLDDDRPAPPGR